MLITLLLSWWPIQWCNFAHFDILLNGKRSNPCFSCEQRFFWQWPTISNVLTPSYISTIRIHVIGGRKKREKNKRKRNDDCLFVWKLSSFNQPSCGAFIIIVTAVLEQTNNQQSPSFLSMDLDRKSAFRDSGSICRRIYIYRSDEGNEGGGTNYCVNGLTCELGPKLLIAPDYVLPYDRWSAAPGLYLLRFSIHWLSNCMVC